MNRIFKKTLDKLCILLYNRLGNYNIIHYIIMNGKHALMRKGSEMATKTVFVCNECGYESSKWLGKCPACSAWNSFFEQKISKTKPSASCFVREPQKSESIRTVDLTPVPRMDSGFSELNRVLGGGIVPGSVCLLGGDPGIGKSTLLLQICSNLAKNGERVLYASGEESKTQIKMRAIRLCASEEEIFLYAENELNAIMNEAQAVKPGILVVDSIQTVYSEEITSTPGSISQVRECTMRLMRYAKETNTCVFIVGHMTKDGMIAGPKVLEHMVDCVLYFEGEKQSAYRIIRTNKNRFGSSNEIAVFDMLSDGLSQITNPSELFIGGRVNGVSGSAIACTLEGSRPILAEVQALVSKTAYNNPRRSGTGIDFNRLHLMIAVLEKRAGLSMLPQSDVYVNLTGGLSVSEPACDLAIAMAIASGVKNLPLISDCAVFGEIGLLGEIRSVSGIEKRISEAEKLGFTRCILPYHNYTYIKASDFRLELIPVRSILDAFQKGFSTQSDF